MEQSLIEECKFLGYILGTCSGWDGDVEALMFNDFKPISTVKNWPKEADTIHINMLDGIVGAYGSEDEPLMTWPWRDFATML